MKVKSRHGEKNAFLGVLLMLKSTLILRLKEALFSWKEGRQLKLLVAVPC